jgi:hypothetical protein
MRFSLRKKKKQPILLTGEEVRQIVKEELVLSEWDKKKQEEELKRKELNAQRLMALPPRKRLKALRYLKRKGEDYGKK